MPAAPAPDALRGLAERLASGDPAIIGGALDALAEVVIEDLDAAASDVLRPALVAAIDVDPDRPDAARAVWLLGKLHDPALEPYLAALLARYLAAAWDAAWHLRQTAIALDNLGAMPAWSAEDPAREPAAIREAATAYLRDRA